MSRYAHLTSRDEIRERIGARWHDQRSDLAVIGDLDGLPIGDMTQDVTALIAHLTMRDGPHVAQRSTPFRWLERMRDVLGDRFVAGVALYSGPHVLPFGDRLLAMPIPALWEL